MILIRQGNIVDGSGRKPYRGDVLIDGRKISAIGNFPSKKADLIIDALGLTVTPGFIDVNTDSDHHLSLFTQPAQKDFLAQGVTTIIGGQCGASLAPLLYGSLISISRWTNTDQVNVDWRSVGELFAILQRLKLGVNFGMHVGHSTIRRDLIGDEIRDLTESEIQILLNMLRQALRDGVLGVSTGLGYIHGQHIPYSELKRVVSLLTAYNRIYTTHLRDEKTNLEASIQETVKLAEETGVATLISHLRPIIGFEHQFSEGISYIEKHLVHANIFFDVSPFPVSLMPVYALLPEWAKNGGREIMLGHLRNASVRKDIVAALTAQPLSQLKVVDARNQEAIIGKTLEEIARTRNVSPVEYLMELMETTGLRAIVSTENVNIGVLEDLLFHNRSLIGSHGASVSEHSHIVRLDRSTATFPRFLQLAEKRKLPIEEAIKKITSTPAQLFRIKQRGLIKNGYFADISMLDNQKKIQHVLVNGQHALESGVFTHMLGGTMIHS